MRYEITAPLDQATANFFSFWIIILGSEFLRGTGSPCSFCGDPTKDGSSWYPSPDWDLEPELESSDNGEASFDAEPELESSDDELPDWDLERGEALTNDGSCSTVVYGDNVDADPDLDLGWYDDIDGYLYTDTNDKFFLYY